MVWRPSLNPGQDLASLLATALLPTPIPNLTDAVQRAGAYGYEQVTQQEEAPSHRTNRPSGRAATTLRHGPVLRLPLRDMRVGFDPNRVEPLDSVGPVYAALRIVDSWGVLDVTDGGGLIRDWQEAIVPAPKITKGKISGPGWTLDLAEGVDSGSRDPSGRLHRKSLIQLEPRPRREGGRLSRMPLRPFPGTRWIHQRRRGSRPPHRPDPVHLVQ
jgi:hypothetical protein